GNPGENYAATRHNAGFWCVDYIAKERSVKFSRRNRSTLVGECDIEGQRVVLAKPRAFVNRSGQAVSYLLTRFGVTPEKLLIIYDEIALPLGKIRLRPTGSAGGHNGIKSIIEATGTQDFPRLRFGVDRPPNGEDQIAYVIGTLSDEEQKVADEVIVRVAESVSSLLTVGIERTMNKFN
ncbi:MAG: aminoacyl-tRNA hydrolase, partial [Chloroflexi bacterium]|nr:aminoacyl-tRNA hydrolase [Chloroflexota bacterium]